MGSEFSILSGLDLGANYSITGVKLHWGQQQARTTRYRYQLIMLTGLMHIQGWWNRGTEEITFAPVTGRYVKCMVPRTTIGIFVMGIRSIRSN